MSQQEFEEQQLQPNQLEEPDQNIQQNQLEQNEQQEQDEYLPEGNDRWNSSLKIQKLWRSYTNRKIYKYYKDIILFKCKGNPARLLKAINPNEAQLLEAASNVHLRFRLGGENFPPNIYYKIYLHGGQCDVNSFAPRDYSLIQRPQNPHSHQKITYDKYKQNKDQYQDEGWYLRIDNNGWRPISHKVLNKTDYVEVFSANKIKYFHFKKDKRQEKTTKKKRLNKLRWLQNMYKNARKEEEEQQEENKQNQNEINDNEFQDYLDIPKDYNPLKDDKFVELDEEEFDDEVKDLIEWSTNLDYDQYVKDWFQLSTSNASENFVSQPVNKNISLSSTIIQQQAQLKSQQALNSGGESTQQYSQLQLTQDQQNQQQVYQQQQQLDI